MKGGAVCGRWHARKWSPAALDAAAGDGSGRLNPPPRLPPLSTHRQVLPLLLRQRRRRLALAVLLAALLAAFGVLAAVGVLAGSSGVCEGKQSSQTGCWKTPRQQHRLFHAARHRKSRLAGGRCQRGPAPALPTLPPPLPPPLPSFLPLPSLPPFLTFFLRPSFPDLSVSCTAHRRMGSGSGGGPPELQAVGGSSSVEGQHANSSSRRKRTA